MNFDNEYADEHAWRSASRRKRVVFVTFVTVAVTVLLVGLGTVVYALNRPVQQRPAAAKVQVDASSPADLPSVQPLPTDPATTAPAKLPTTGAPSPTRTSAHPKVSKSVARPKETVVPPPPPPPAAPGCKPTYTGANAPHADVRAALDSAADFTFWKSSAQIKVPAK